MRRLILLICIMLFAFPISAFAATATVEKTVNFRSAPKTNSSVYGYIKAGTKLNVLEEVNAWWMKVEYNGKTGYVSTGYVSDVSGGSAPIENPPAQVPSSQKADKVIELAKSYMGRVSYDYGTRNVSKLIFDCSSFTQFIFDKVGVSIKWGTKYQKTAGTYVSKSNLKKGDLILLRVGSSSSIGHVGIYMGDGNMIHNTPSVDGIQISSIRSGYWADRYVTARRVL